jgi:hypothetical protein
MYRVLTCSSDIEATSSISEHRSNDLGFGSRLKLIRDNSRTSAHPVSKLRIGVCRDCGINNPRITSKLDGSQRLA